MQREQLISAARGQLEDVILPYWRDVGIDRVHGGFHTCFDNRGVRRTGTDKFAWSQGRFVWMLARAARLAGEGRLQIDADEAVADARAGAVFLRDHALLDDGTTRFVVGRDGGEPTGDGHPERSVYADCFVAMGFAELAHTTGEEQWLAAADSILERVTGEILDARPPTPPYPVPAGYEAYGPLMILLNTLCVFGDAERDRGADERRAAEVDTVIQRITGHRRADGTVSELIRADGLDDETSLHGRHRVPGHALEGVWMLLEAGRNHDDEMWLDSIPALCASGWDEEYGGIHRYVDMAGPQRHRRGSEQPRGRA